MKQKPDIKIYVHTLDKQVDSMISYFHEMNPRPDYGVRNGTVHAILCTLSTLKTLLEMLYAQL